MRKVRLEYEWDYGANRPVFGLIEPSRVNSRDIMLFSWSGWAGTEWLNDPKPDDANDDR